jgi:uncharacterized membrane protein
LEELTGACALAPPPAGLWPDSGETLITNDMAAMVAILERNINVFTFVAGFQSVNQGYGQ